MSYPYSAGPMNYANPNMQVPYEEMAENKSCSLPYGITGAVIGAAGGGLIASRINPYVSIKGEVQDSFAKRAYEKYITKGKGTDKKLYEQTKDILEKIGSVHKPEDLKALFDENQDIMKIVCNELKQTPDEFCNNITQSNLSANKKIISERLKNGNKFRFQNMKNVILSCWDSKKREFSKPDSISRDMYDAIKDATDGAKTKVIAKYAAIGAAITGAIAFIAHKAITYKTQGQNQQQMQQQYYG